MLQSLAAAPLEATAAQSSAFPPRFALCTPHVVAVGAGSSYSAFVDNRGRLFTCGTMDAPLGHDVAQLSRLVASAEQAKAALAAAGSPGNDTGSVILYYNGRYHTRSAAALNTFKLLGGAWPLLYAFIIVPPFIRNTIYNQIARNRYKWFGQRSACMVPTPELAARFLS